VFDRVTKIRLRRLLLTIRQVRTTRARRVKRAVTTGVPMLPPRAPHSRARAVTVVLKRDDVFSAWGFKLARQSAADGAAIIETVIADSVGFEAIRPGLAALQRLKLASPSRAASSNERDEEGTLAIAAVDSIRIEGGAAEVRQRLLGRTHAVLSLECRV
jgi:hypothetical protein